jgi:fucose permease
MRPRAGLLALSYLAFVSLGLPDTVLGVAWPSLRETFRLSQAGLGTVLAATVAGYFLSGILAGRLVSALGVGGLLAWSSAFVAIGLAGYAVAPNWWLFFPVGTVIGLGSGAVDAALNGYAARHFPVRHLNWLHACYSLGATLGPLAMTAVLAKGASFRVGYAALAATLAAMAVSFTATRRSWDDPSAAAPGPAGGPAAPRATAMEALRSGRVWLQIAIFFVYTGLEAGTGQWCFTFLREARGLDLETAGGWTTGYWGSIAAGRVVLGFLVDLVGPDRLLRVATFGALAGSVAFATSAGTVGRIGLVLLGVSLAPLFPTLMARTPGRLGHEVSVHAVGFQVSAGTLGAAALPGALGVLAARAGVGAIGFAVVSVAVALALLHEALVRSTRTPRS